MAAKYISLIMGNFGLVMLILAIILIIINKSVAGNKVSGYEITYRWIAIFPLGITALYAFVMHAFFPDFTAQTIGWQNSPFQYEVAMANLGFGLIGLCSAYASFGFRLAAVIGNTCWLWGDATGHIYQMLTEHNFTIGNAGSWFWLDVIIPLILIICITKLASKTDK